MPSVAATLLDAIADSTLGTNYVMWWPFNQNGAVVSDEQSILYRFSLQLS